MDYFNLPSSTIVQRVVPKNSFEPYATSKQKNMFAKDVAKIIWSYCLSQKTINLPSRDIQEIQIFTLELKEQKDIKPILDIIDKAIPYHIIFIVEYNGWMYFSTSAKHSSPLNESKSVIDWTFKTPWFKITENSYRLDLQKSLDGIFTNFCNQLSIHPNKDIKDLPELISYNSKLYEAMKKIESLKKKISSCNQFNKKVEMNMKVRELQEKLSELRHR